MHQKAFGGLLHPQSGSFIPIANANSYGLSHEMLLSHQLLPAIRRISGELRMTVPHLTGCACSLKNVMQRSVLRAARSVIISLLQIYF